MGNIAAGAIIQPNRIELTTKVMPTEKFTNNEIFQRKVCIKFTKGVCK